MMQNKPFLETEIGKEMKYSIGYEDLKKNLIQINEKENGNYLVYNKQTKKKYYIVPKIVVFMQVFHIQEQVL